MSRIWSNRKTPPPPWATDKIVRRLQSSLPVEHGWSVSVDWCWSRREWHIEMCAEDPPVCVSYHGASRTVYLNPSARHATDALIMTHNWPWVRLPWARLPLGAEIDGASRLLVQKSVRVCEAWMDNLPTEWRDRDLYHACRYSDDRRAAARASLQQIHKWASALATQMEIEVAE